MYYIHYVVMTLSCDLPESAASLHCHSHIFSRHGITPDVIFRYFQVLFSFRYAFINTVNLDRLLFSTTVFCLLGKYVILNTANCFFFMNRTHSFSVTSVKVVDTMNWYRISSTGRFEKKKNISVKSGLEQHEDKYILTMFIFWVHYHFKSYCVIGDV